MPQSLLYSKTVVIFDLDGTLVDSAPDLAAAMNVVLRSEGYAELPPSEVRHLVGHGARALLVAGFAAHGRHDVPDDEMATYVDRFVDYYRDHLADESRPFPGSIDAMNSLLREGAKLAVCTNKREELTYPLLRALELENFFDSIICRDTLPVYKPDPAPLLACLDRTESQQGIMIGDTTTDLTAAHAANMPCLIARSGYGVFGAEDTKKPRYFDHFDDIPGLIAELLQING